MEKLITRYGLPGVPTGVAFGLYLYLFLRPQPAPEILVSLTLIAIIFAGFVLQQIWLFLFEWGPWSYSAPTRRALRKIKKINNNINDMQLYVIWETALYSEETDQRLFDKDKVTWNSYHTNASNGLGMLVGAFLFFLIKNTSIEFWIHLFSGLFFAVGVLLFIKAFQTRRIIENLEENWVLMWKNRISTIYEDMAVKKPSVRARKSKYG